MDNICEKSKCTGCRACENICPVKAIKMVEDSKGFLYPQIDTDKCVNCYKCRGTCPIINMPGFEQTTKLYACKNKDNEKRSTSSSGGMFTEICEYIFENEGIVYGAAFNKEHKVEHVNANNLEELEKIKKSKYVQSNMNTTYRDIESNLKNGKKVLFSGSPCQVQAVKNYIENDNLVCIDIVCHGVPSPKIFEDYKKYLEEEYKSKITNINFRHKANGITQNIKVDFENGESYISSDLDGDVFYRLFARDYILRDSCYNCDFKTFERVGDITLADFWGYDKGPAKEFGDKKGVSLVFINTQKGMDIFEKIKDKIEYVEISAEDCIPYNCFSNFEIPEETDELWREYFEEGFQTLVKRMK